VRTGSAAKAQKPPFRKSAAAGKAPEPKDAGRTVISAAAGAGIRADRKHCEGAEAAVSQERGRGQGAGPKDRRI